LFPSPFLGPPQTPPRRVWCFFYGTQKDFRPPVGYIPMGRLSIFLPSLTNWGALKNEDKFAHKIRPGSPPEPIPRPRTLGCFPPGWRQARPTPWGPPPPSPGPHLLSLPLQKQQTNGKKGSGKKKRRKRFGPPRPRAGKKSPVPAFLARPPRNQFSPPGPPPLGILVPPGSGALAAQRNNVPRSAWSREEKISMGRVNAPPGGEKKFGSPR